MVDRRTPKPWSARTVAVACAIMTAMIVFAGSALLFWMSGREAASNLAGSANVFAESVGLKVAEQIGRGVGYGIPLEKLYGVPAYLHGVAERHRLVRFIAVVDQDGRSLFSGGDPAQTIGAVAPVRVPILASGQNGSRNPVPAGSVIVMTSPSLSGAPLGRLGLELVGAALLSALIAGAAVIWAARAKLDAVRHDMTDRLGMIAAGQFGGGLPRAGHDRGGQLAEAVAHLIAGVRSRYGQLMAEAETIRAIDFDGSLASRLDPLLRAAVGRYRFSSSDFDDAEAAVRGSDGGDQALDWPLLPLVAVLFLVQPFVPNFAVDRDSLLVSDGFLASVPVAIQAMAVTLGLGLAALAGGTLLRRGARVSIVSLLLLIGGGMTLAVHWCRDYNSFLALLIGTNFSLGAALGLILAGGGQAPRTLSILIAAVIVGPLVGGLLGEALGRRQAFFAAGLVSACLGLLIAFAWRPVARDFGEPRPILDPKFRARTLIWRVWVGMVGGAGLLVILPGIVTFYDYLAAGAIAALAGCASVFGTVLRGKWRGFGVLAAVIGLSLLAGQLGLESPPPVMPDVVSALGCLLIGVGIGVGAGALPVAGQPAIPGQTLACATGVLVGALTVGASLTLGLPSGALPAAAALAGGAAALGLQPHHPPAVTGG